MHSISRFICLSFLVYSSIIRAEKLDLKGQTLNVSVKRWPPFCDFEVKNNKIVPKQSIEFELLKVLESHYNFKANLIDSKQTYGREINGKNSDGVVGLVMNKTCHIGMCGLSIYHERFKYVDYSSMIIRDELTFITKKPGLKSREWIIFSPFAPRVWLFICLSMVVLALVIKTLWNNRRSPSWIVTSLLGVILKQCVTLSCSRHSIRILYATWLVSTLILSNSYAGHFHSILAISEQQPPIDTLDQLVELAKDDRITMIARKNIHNDFILNSTSGIFYELGENIRRSLKKGKFVYSRKVNPPDFLMNRTFPSTEIANRVALQYRLITHSNNDIHIAKESFSSLYRAFIYCKHSPLTRPFNRIIKRSFEHGLIDKWTTDTYASAKKSQKPMTEDTQKVKALKLKDLQSIFVIWSLLGTASIFVFLLECLVHSQMFVKKRVNPALLGMISSPYPEKSPLSTRRTTSRMFGSLPNIHHSF